MFAKKPAVSEIKLSRDYRFMYENFVVLTQQGSYLLLEKSGAGIHALHFDSPYCKYSGPNDEAHGGHPLAEYGLGIYGFFQVENSPWIKQMMTENRVHPRHSDSLFAGYKHYVACFKDIKFESVCRNMREITLTKSELEALIAAQVQELES